MTLVQKLTMKFGGFAHPEKLKNAFGSLVGWGAFGGLIGLSLLEPIPAFQYYLAMIPLAGAIWKKKIADRERKF